MAARVLITGSRTWTNTATIREALLAVWGDGATVLISGACPRGADRIAEMFWTRWGGRIERHPADWTRHGRSAGMRRNAVMVAAGADVCLAFIRDDSPGASHTARLAEHAGIPTHRYLTP
ncbi:MAG: SLOG family protein [Pseudonocardiaceae bacterium]